jgi:hypothetical protein
LKPSAPDPRRWLRKKLLAYSAILLAAVMTALMLGTWLFA